MCNNYSPNPNHTENLTCQVHGANNGDVHTPHVGNDKAGIHFYRIDPQESICSQRELPFLKEHG